MAQNEDKFTKRRVRSSYFSVVVSIALVLFVLGTFGTLVLNANDIAKRVKENFAVTLLLENDASEVVVRQFRKELQLTPHVKNTKYISKKEAAQQLKKELDEEFVEFLGYNPLNNSIEIRLKAPYVKESKLASLEKKYAAKAIVSEVVYDKPLIQKMNDNIEKISFFLIGGCVLLALIAIGLINSSIRLAIYSRRFLIKTMQLVGATKGFIRKPFINRSFRHGIYGAFIALVLLGVLLYYVDKNVPGLEALQNFKNMAILAVSLVGAGILISMSCTFFALKKYLKLKTDQLYF